MDNIIGIDFESAPTINGINTWNFFYNVPIEIGMFSLNTKNTFSEIIKEKVILTPWHIKNTPHLNEETINKGENKCTVAAKMLNFLKNECTKNCKLIKHGDTDYKWFMQMYENCKKEKDDLNKTFNVIDNDFYQKPKLDKTKINLVFFDTNQAQMKYYPTKSAALSKMYKDIYNENMLNHKALDDAKAAALIANEKFKEYL